PHSTPPFPYTTLFRSKSQGQGTPARRGSALNYFAHIKGEPATKDLFDGVDLTWRRVRGGEAVGQTLAEAAQKYDAANPQAILPLDRKSTRLNSSHLVS